jgi:hypothetical protein
VSSRALPLSVAQTSVAIACAIVASCVSQPPPVDEGFAATLERIEPPRTTAQLAWMTGEWRAVEGDFVQEERWSTPLGGLMLGSGRTVIDGQARFFECLRIEERPEGLVYVASPLGRGTTEYPLTDGGPWRARFENPAHDWPTALEYELRADGRLAARVSGPGKKEEYVWDRVR